MKTRLSYVLEKHPDLKGCFGTNDETVLLGAQALKSMEEDGRHCNDGLRRGKGSAERSVRRQH